MAPLPQGIVKRGSFLGLLLALALSSTGCVALSPWKQSAESPPVGQPSQVVMTWKPSVTTTPDVVNGGSPIPGLVGRLYLFGAQMGHPMAGDGNLRVELFDDRPSAQGGQPTLLEFWEIDQEKLCRLLQKDSIGWGYTLFLPWGSYHPDVKKVRLKVCYLPPAGPPLYAPISSLTLQHEEIPHVVRQGVQVPGQPVSRKVEGS